MELLFGGVPGRPKGDGLDGHAWWPLFSATPIEYIENYYPVLVESYRPIEDSGGPDLHRGGAGIEKIYRMLEAGKVSIHDDREVVPPWGINGGLHRRHVEQVADQGRLRQARAHPLEDRQSRRQARATASSSRPPAPAGGAIRSIAIAEEVARDVRYGLVSAETAKTALRRRADQRPTVDAAATAKACAERCQVRSAAHRSRSTLAISRRSAKPPNEVDFGKTCPLGGSCASLSLAGTGSRFGARRQNRSAGATAPFRQISSPWHRAIDARARSADADRRDAASTASPRPCPRSAGVTVVSRRRAAPRLDDVIEAGDHDILGDAHADSITQGIHRAHRHDVVDDEQRVGPPCR